MKCDFCQKTGHLRDTCFKLHGYPDWWPDSSKVKAGKPYASAVNENFEEGESSNPLELNDGASHMNSQNNMQAMIANMIQLELGKMLKGKGKEAAGDVNFSNFPYFGDFSGPQD